MYQVINEFVDRSTGKRVRPGESFEPSTSEQAERLLRARCLVRVAPEGGAAESSSTASPPQTKKRRRRSEG
ncbi:hypothetical protein [Vulgatibacter sp.]|uniref:hypothetical protein n=1 Tax=Vulgatibacter sp. TaxID=1971226 RepID=UPI0035635A91